MCLDLIARQRAQVVPESGSGQRALIRDDAGRKASGRPDAVRRSVSAKPGARAAESRLHGLGIVEPKCGTVGPPVNCVSVGSRSAPTGESPRLQSAAHYVAVRERLGRSSLAPKD
jgi:hypothetical protein